MFVVKFSVVQINGQVYGSINMAQPGHYTHCDNYILTSMKVDKNDPQRLTIDKLTHYLHRWIIHVRVHLHDFIGVRCWVVDLTTVKIKESTVGQK